MLDEKINSDMRKHREKNFQVREEIECHKLYSDEKILSMTHNGYQWSSFSVIESEAKMIIAKLQEMFKNKE